MYYDKQDAVLIGMEYTKKFIFPDKPKVCPLMYAPCDLTWVAVWQFVVDVRAMCPRRTGGFSAGEQPVTAGTPALTSSAARSATLVSPASASTKLGTSSTAAGTTGPTAASSAVAWYE